MKKDFNAETRSRGDAEIIRFNSAELDDNENTTTLSIPAPAAGLSLPQRIQHYHRLSREAGQISIMAALAAGIELQRAKEACEHGMFTHWVKTNCEFGQRTANKYMLLAESLLPEGAVAGLLEGPEDTRQELLAQAAAQADARTLTDLYADLGIVRPYKSNMGGARPGAGRPRKVASPVEIAQTELTIAISQSHVFASQLRAWALEDDALGMLPDEVLQPWLLQIGEVLKRGREILEGRRVNKKIQREHTL